MGDGLWKTYAEVVTPILTTIVLGITSWNALTTVDLLERMKAVETRTMSIEGQLRDMRLEMLPKALHENLKDRVEKNEEKIDKLRR